MMNETTNKGEAMNDLFKSKLSAAELADMLYDLCVARGDRRVDAWYRADEFERVGRAALVREIEDNFQKA
jgi:hypothetical protein